MQVSEQAVEVREPAPEARAVLTARAGTQFGRIPGGLLVEHLERTYGGADWPVRREALEALLRRWKFAQRDDLEVARRPSGSVLGEYALRTPTRKVRPYRTLLASLEPLRGSCGCPDFRRGSLGLCKHLLVVLDDVAGRKNARRKGLSGRPAGAASRLEWDPVRPLVGADDWLERVRLEPGASAASRRSKLARRFTAGVGSAWVLRQTFAQAPQQRLELVRDLLARAAHDPALEARLREERGELERVLRLRGAKRSLTAALRGLRRPPYPYQREGVDCFLARGRLLLADDMGLGKTVQAVAACHALHRVGLVQRGLLIVPAALKHQWLREWEATTPAPAAIVEGGREQRAQAYERTRKGFLIANYEQLLRDLDLVRAWNPDLVVLDEAQRIKNWEAKTAHAVKSLEPEFRLVLTGTPMENRLEELASVVEWVDDHALEPKWRLVPLHALSADGQHEVRGARHLDTLRARLATCSLRRLRGEVLDQLPGRTDSTIPIDLTPAQQQAHDDLERPIASILRILGSRALRREEFLRLMMLLTRQRQICNGLGLVEFAETWPTLRTTRPSERRLATLEAPKLGELRALVESLVVAQERKVVVFSQWRRMLELAAWSVSDLLRQAGARAVFFSGQESQRRRTQNLVDFHDDPATRILFATDAGGVGLNLQRAASAAILLELPWNPAVLEQRVGRIHRLGQTEPVQVWAIVARGGIEERLAKLVGDKQALFRGVFDGASDEVLFDHSGSFLQGLQREVAQHRSLDPDDQEGDPDLREGELDQPAELEAQDLPVVPAAEVAPGSPSLPGLRVERAPDGTVRIEAPAEQADLLIGLLEGLLGALRAGQGTTPAP